MKYIKSYNNFILENMDQAKSIMNRKIEAFDKLKTLLSKNLGYIGKFTEYLFNENISFEDLEKLYKELVYLKKRNVSIDINNYKYEKLIDKILEENNNIIVKNLINEFPAEQKVFAKELIKDNFNLFVKVAKKENVKRFTDNISRYKTEDALVKSMEIFSKDPINDKDNVLATINSTKSRVAYDKDNLLIVQVDSEDTIKKLANDCSWCIVHNNMWDYYNKNRYQYILYNYDLDEYDVDFKIGFTLEKNGNVYEANDVLNKNAKTKLEKILLDNNIKKSDILPVSNNKPLLTNIESIKSKTPLKDIKLLADECLDSELIPLLNKLTSMFKMVDLTPTQSDILKTIVKRIFKDKEYLYIKDIENVSPSILGIVKNTKLGRKIIDLNTVDINHFDSEIVISKKIDFWSDEMLLNFYKTAYQEGFVYIFFKNYGFEDFEFSKELTTKMSDRINALYDKYGGEDKKLEFDYIYFNYRLDRKELVKNREEIIKTNGYVKRHPNIFKTKLDLSTDNINRNYPITDTTIMMKDYDDTKVHIYPNSANEISKLVDLFKNNKLTMNILTSRLNTYGFYPKVVNDIIRLLKKNKSDQETIGNITIKIN